MMAGLQQRVATMTAALVTGGALPPHASILSDLNLHGTSPAAGETSLIAQYADIKHPATAAATAWLEQASSAGTYDEPFCMPVSVANDKRPFGSLPAVVYGPQQVVARLLDPPADPVAAQALQQAAQNLLSAEITEGRVIHRTIGDLAGPAQLRLGLYALTVRLVSC